MPVLCVCVLVYIHGTTGEAGRQSQTAERKRATDGEKERRKGERLDLHLVFREVV